MIPHISVGCAKARGAGLADGRQAVSRNRNLARSSCEEHSQRHRFPLDNTGSRGKHLRESADLNWYALADLTSDHRYRDNSGARVVAGPCGVSAKHKPFGRNDPGRRPNASAEGLQDFRLDLRWCRVSRRGKASHPQRGGRPPWAELVPVRRRGRPSAFPPFTLQQNMPEASVLLAQWALDLSGFAGGVKRTLPHRAQRSEVLRLLGLRLQQTPRHRPVNPVLCAFTCVLLADAVVGSVLKEAREPFFNSVNSRLVGFQGYRVVGKSPKARAGEAARWADPPPRVAAIDAVILQVGDKRCNWALNQRPPPLGRGELFPGDVPEALACLFQGLCEEQLV